MSQTRWVKFGDNLAVALDEIAALKVEGETTYVTLRSGETVQAGGWADVSSFVKDVS